MSTSTTIKLTFGPNTSHAGEALESHLKALCYRYSLEFDVYTEMGVTKVSSTYTFDSAVLPELLRALTVLQRAEEDEVNRLKTQYDSAVKKMNNMQSVCTRLSEIQAWSATGGV